MEKQAPLQRQHLELTVLNRLGSSQRQTDFNGNHVAFSFWNACLDGAEWQQVLNWIKLIIWAIDT